MMAPVGFGIRFSRLSTFRASSKGQALLTWAWARSSELTSIFGLAFGLGLAAIRDAASLACGMLASAWGCAGRLLARGLALGVLALGVLALGVLALGVLARGERTMVGFGRAFGSL